MKKRTPLSLVEKKALKQMNHLTNDTLPLSILVEEKAASWQDIQDFLTWNPLAATFEWGDLVMDIRTAERRRDVDENQFWRTPEWIFFIIQTQRPEAFERWKSFNKKE